jgi:SAM-dependent methyltransferase
VSEEIKPNKSILDAGAGDCQYKIYFRRSQYKSQDNAHANSFFKYNQIDIKSEIYNIPVAKSSFDYILCTQVLEHLEYPTRAFKEFRRILKPKGRLFLTAPFIAQEHDLPYDYFRFTKSALRSLSENNGFKVIEINSQGGKCIALGVMIKDLLPLSTKNRQFQLLLYVLEMPIVAPILFFLYLLDFLDKDKECTINYEAIFEKI